MTRGVEKEGDRRPDGASHQRDAEPAATGAGVPAVPPCFDDFRCPTSLETLGVTAALWPGEQCRVCGCGVSGQVFDRGVLDELASMIDDDELDSYLALLEPTVRPRVEKLRRQLEAGEVLGLVETAHALAGGAACYGLAALSAAARRVENGAREEPWDSLRKSVAEAAGLVEASLSAVFRWRCRMRADRSAGLTPSVAEACILTGAIATT